MTRASSPPAVRAMSRSGPSVRGVRSASQPPRSTPSWVAANLVSRAVLPIPASPATSTTRPPSRRACASAASASSRSSSSMAGCYPPVADRSGLAADAGEEPSGGPAVRTVGAPERRLDQARFDED
jgi:hypothetical protein